jgi:hypothetical protein
MDQHESRHWTYEPIPRKLNGMDRDPDPPRRAPEPPSWPASATPSSAISVHVYGTYITRIGGSARRYYD